MSWRLEKRRLSTLC